LNDVIESYIELHQTIINPELNHAFKERAIHCIILSLSFEILLQSPLEFNRYANELITPIQRVMKLHLFAEEALKQFDKLNTCVDNKYKESIAKAMLALEQLKERSKQIGYALENLKKIIDDTEKYIPQHKKYDIDINKESISIIIKYIMEEKIIDNKTFSERIKEIIHDEFEDKIKKIYCVPYNFLFCDFIRFMSQVNAKSKDEIDHLISNLILVYDDLKLTNDEKLYFMQVTIYETYNQLIKSCKNVTLFQPKQSDIADSLRLFVDNQFHSPKEMPHASLQY
jgi:hypothetical protein